MKDKKDDNPERKTLIDTLKEFHVSFIAGNNLIFIYAEIKPNSTKIFPISMSTYIARNGVEITTMKPFLSEVKYLLFRSPDRKERLVELGIYGHVDFEYRTYCVDFPELIVIFGRREEYFPPNIGIHPPEKCIKKLTIFDRLTDVD